MGQVARLVGVEPMLHIHCLQQWFNLSDPAVEEALYDSRSLRQFASFGMSWKSTQIRRIAFRTER